MVAVCKFPLFGHMRKKVMSLQYENYAKTKMISALKTAVFLVDNVTRRPTTS